MRMRHFVFLASSAFVAIGLAMVGCGGSSDSTTPPPDAANDITAVDQSAPDVNDAANQDAGSDACEADGDLLNANVPDADLFDGGSSVGLCVGCIRSSCSTQVGACNDDCGCRSAIIDAYGCLSTNASDPTACFQNAATLPAGSRDIAVAILLCAEQKCPSCQPPKGDGGRDSGDAGDASQDAPDGG